jgi:hypothetical protein
VLEIQLEAADFFDEDHEEFIDSPPATLRFEHSLVSVSKWESVFEKPFLADEPKTAEETLAYVRMMCLDDKIPPEVFSQLSSKHYDVINAYINAKMTATTINERPGSRPGFRETITSELIYYWMVSYNIPFECETWHLNRLIMLIRVCNHKQAPAKKMGRQEAAQQRHELNAQRRARLGTKG